MSGTRLGPYEVLEPLGSGGMGEVYRARDPRLRREVAIKVVLAAGEPDADRLRRFEDEAHAVAALSHPNVLTVHDVGSHEGRPFLVLELLEGETLRQRLERGPLPPRRAIEVGVEVCRGLEAAHTRGLVHRDLKPENLFVTTDGRVKILDFGLAKLTRGDVESGLPGAVAAGEKDTKTAPGLILGTLGYLSPEQARGLGADGRSDLFALGAVLYEMLSGRRAFQGKTPADTLSAILNNDPPTVSSASGPIPAVLDRVVRRCLAKDAGERFHSAHDLALALETVLDRPLSGPSVAEEVERSPYPGLSSFTEADAGRFFGREAEVESLWDKVRAHPLLALIGPSGAGKTSFLRAGVIPDSPSGWGVVYLTPGRDPVLSLAQALTPALAGDAQAVGELLRGVAELVQSGEADSVVSAVSRWRGLHPEVLVVVDQFEELFTLCPSATQAAFAGLLGRLVEEGGVHVLLSLRDDFLMRCHDHEALGAVFDHLTPLGALGELSLRRAVTEPAKREGFEFEDEALVETMLSAVDGERGALPLLAFAVSRLWEKRDRDSQRLTREAYEQIGGVAGALAQHAEATLERIGVGKEGVVREIFRNLVTAQGTRASCRRTELLSAFSEGDGAEKVLEELIAARLLTSYEVMAPEGREGRAGHGDSGRHRIEIVHESLLKAWPRLVWWQAQDDEGAQLRDQLKQAAHLWDEKGRSEDLLWSGTAEHEFEVWRERYPGQLTTVEDDFAKAMVQRARRRKRLRQMTSAALVLGLSLVVGVIAVSRHNEATARREAEANARRAEGEKLLALGQARLSESPTEALAFALAGLEVHDSPHARRFVVETLSKGPPAHRLPHGKSDSFMKVAFSDDGRFFAAAGSVPEIPLWAEDGTPVGEIERPGVDVPWPPLLRFVPGADLLGVSEYLNDAGLIRFWSVPEGELVRRAELDHPTYLLLAAQEFVSMTIVGGWGQGRLGFRAWPADGGEPRDLGVVDLGGLGPGGMNAVDATGQWVAEVHGEVVRLRRLDAKDDTPGREIARLPGPVRGLHLGPLGRRLVAVQDTGDIRVWPLGSEASEASHALPAAPVSPEDLGNVRFSPDGSRFAIEAGLRTFAWDLEGPPDARPLELVSGHTGTMQYLGQAAFGPRGRWLARAAGPRLDFWPLGNPTASVLSGAEGLTCVTFAPDSQWLVTASWDGQLRLWPLSSAAGPRHRVLLEKGSLNGVSVDPRGSRIAVAQKFDGEVFVVPLSGGAAPERLAGFSKDALLGPVALGPEGRLVAAAATYDPQGPVIRVWDTATGAVQVLNPRGAGVDTDDPTAGGVWKLVFAPDGRLLSVGDGGVRRWDLEEGTSEPLWGEPSGKGGALIAFTVSPDGRQVVTQRVDEEDRWDSEVFIEDLQTGDTVALGSHGSLVQPVALDIERGRVATGGRDGIVRVGLLNGAEPHLFYGDGEGVASVALSPDGRWVAAATARGAIRLWPLPDVSETPLHALPYEELLARLRSFTNLRAVPDELAPGGYDIEIGPFPGWRDVPEW